MASKKKTIKTRDHLMVKVINGVTKAGIHKDQKKEANKKTSRSRVEVEIEKCLQCLFPFKEGTGKTEDENAAMEYGFCSVSCMDYHSETSNQQE
jgi:hypothetical protein